VPDFSSYELVGAKEDISDVITNISPRKTPFQTAIGSEKVTQKLFQWQEDSLRATADNAQGEGFDATYITVNATAMRQNVTQIFAEAVQVSGTVDATSTYGRARESAYQLAKSAAQVKRDLEFAMVGQNTVLNAGTTPNGTNTPRHFASYSQLLTVAGNVAYAGVGNTVSEANLLTALQNCWNNGAEPSVISVTAANSITVAGFAKAAGRYRTIVDANSGSGKVVNAVDLYVSPFGQVKVVLNRFQKSSWTLVFDPEMWVKATLRPWFRETLAKTGDSLKQMIVGEFSLKHKNFLASSLVVDGATTGF
jgi:hypothetical protein